MRSNGYIVSSLYSGSGYILFDADTIGKINEDYIEEGLNLLLKIL